MFFHSYSGGGVLIALIILWFVNYDDNFTDAAACRYNQTV
ncbi:hypothetical protein ASFVK49_0780 [African swine fever virus]|nr:hypothetical protein ASFVK49_0780 [African swine fever virus]